MTEMQARDIIENCLKAHWPAWEFKGQELKVWLDELRKFDASTAEQAIDELYKSWDSTRYPKMPQIMAKIRDRMQHNRQQHVECVPLYQILREDGSPKGRPIFGPSNLAGEQLTEIATRHIGHINRMFPGTRHSYITIDNTTEQAEQYYGPDARDRAIDEILEGPDTKTRRWLEAYLAKKNRRTRLNDGAREKAIEELAKKQPVTVGESIPF